MCGGTGLVIVIVTADGHASRAACDSGPEARHGSGHRPSSQRARQNVMTLSAQIVHSVSSAIVERRTGSTSGSSVMPRASRHVPQAPTATPLGESLEHSLEVVVAVGGRDRLWDGLRAFFGDGVVLNGHPDDRLPNTLNVSFVGRPGADVIATLGDVAASTGSACHADSIELSPVLLAMGVEPRVGMGAVRLSLGRMTTPDEIDAVLERFTRIDDPR